MNGGSYYNYSGDEVFYAGAGNDSIYGYDGNDTIYAGDGDDYLYGGDGDDILVAGAGNDYMQGGYGADTYIHTRGEGNSTINNYDYSAARVNDKLVLNGIKAEDVSLERKDYDLIIHDTVSGERITIESAFDWNDGRKYLENIEFGDGTVWGKEDIKNQTINIYGTDGGNNLYGGSYYNYSCDEVFYAGAGNDYVNGYGGNDTIYGGDGNDTIYGGDGNDIFRRNCKRL